MMPPTLPDAGAFHPTEVYTHQDVQHVVEEGRLRGIRIIPEIDTPGHVWAGFAAIDGLLTTCYNHHDAATNEGRPVVSGTGPLDPTKESTYTFLAGLFGEVAPLFDEKMFMVGGDEVDYSCWHGAWVSDRIVCARLPDRTCAAGV
jgi:hexosaminidase